MKKSFFFALFISVGFQLVIGQNPINKSQHTQLLRLISKMTLKEKIGQMTQINIDVISKGEVFNLIEPHSLDSAKMHKILVEYGVGSILNAGGHAYSLEHWKEIVSTIQRFATTKTRMGIPVLYGIDAIHGANYLLNGTLFPHPLAQAATFNPGMVQKAARITAYETKACGITWNFSPVLDVGRQPLWSRMFETYGEDVLLARKMGSAVVRGYQSSDSANPGKMAACMKHFLGYSFPFTGKDRTSAYISDIQLREYFLPPFTDAIKNGAMSVMINSGDINGIPVHANKSILVDLLRKELKFDGVAVTDWEDIYKLVNVHHVAKDEREAVKMAINAGIDMSMVPNDLRFSDLLYELTLSGEVPQQRIDEAVYRILAMKLKLGMFENCMPFSKADFPEVASDSFISIAENIAEESITLLKNAKNILPLAKTKKLLITGPASNNNMYLNGAWSRTWQGTHPIWDKNSRKTIADVILQEFPESDWIQGCTIDSLTNNKDVFSEKLNHADMVLFCAGEWPSTEKPGDINELKLSTAQENLIKSIAAAGKPIVLLLFVNRPVIIREIEPLCDAIILAYHPSENGVRPIAKILSGQVNPSGKLPITYPKFANSLLTYDHRYADQLANDFSLNAFQPQWEFGAGLGYSKIKYSNLKISESKSGKKRVLSIAVDIENTGSMDAKESVLLFVSDITASIAPAVKRLRAFDKISVSAGAKKTVHFQLDLNELGFVNRNSKWIFEPGVFKVSISNLSSEININ